VTNARRFPPPWTVAEANDACFIVRDANELAVAFVYREDEPGRRATGKLLTRDETRRIAANIANCRSCCGARAFLSVYPTKTFWGTRGHVYDR
jgi:hypothetical protein